LFVSEIRADIHRLLAAGLSQNEIAHRLAVARSTVGYHVAELRRLDDVRAHVAQRNEGSHPPVAPVAVTREQVRSLLDAGMTRAAVAQQLGLARSTVSYHARNLNRGTDPRFARRYDWVEIACYYDAGHTPAQCRSRFGFAKPTWHDAIRRGVIVPRPARAPLEQLLVAGPRRSRGHIKQRLFDAGVKERRCEVCGLETWRGLPVSLALHHVNGDRHDNRIQNLEILCPNCHAQTDTWAGRNRHREPVASTLRRAA
jgi:DNA-binding CsgD family transcriptional regulator